MNKFNLNVKSFFDGEKMYFNQSVEVMNGKIFKVCKSKLNEADCIGTLVPGYIDVQVNGGGGFLFNQTPSLNTIQKIGHAHQQFGTTGWLPTLVTDSAEKMEKAADAVSLAIKNKEPGVLGIHFEGPYLSKQKKGVHSESLIREMSPREFEIITRKDLGKVVVTLAPENVSIQQINDLVSKGVIVCLGHSNATFEQTNRALQAGATGFTHLFNAMSGFESRKPGMVGAALLDEKSYAGLILDGIHVHPDSAQLANKIKNNIMLVTDAMPPVGSNESSFEFFGGKIIRQGLKLTDGEGRLAGSALDMHSAVKNAQEMLGVDCMQANMMASKNPACFLGLNKEYGYLKEGYHASMLLLNSENEIISSWIDGVNVI